MSTYEPKLTPGRLQRKLRRLLADFRSLSLQRVARVLVQMSDNSTVRMSVVWTIRREQTVITGHQQTHVHAKSPLWQIPLFEICGHYSDLGVAEGGERGRKRED